MVLEKYYAALLYTVIHKGVVVVQALYIGCSGLLGTAVGLGFAVSTRERSGHNRDGHHQ